MSEEAAFLEALRANPADDTTRLVYADWLDEHDRPREAEYLRATAELAATGPVVNPSSPTLPRLIDLAVGLEADWLHAAGSRFALILEGYPPGQKIATIKELRTCFNLGLAVCKAVSEHLPACLAACVPAHVLVEIDRIVSRARGVRVRYVRAESPQAIRAYRFDVTAEYYPHSPSQRAAFIAVLREGLKIRDEELSARFHDEHFLVARAADARTVGRYQSWLRSTGASYPDPIDAEMAYFDATVTPVRSHTEPA
jgi:uncharacterized protein (TIGR02996 family)